MIKKEIEVENPNGIHARPSALIVKTAQGFENCEIKILSDTKEVSAKSVIGLMTLGARKGVKLTIMADGEKEQEAIDEISKIFKLAY